MHFLFSLFVYQYDCKKYMDKVRYLSHITIDYEMSRTDFHNFDVGRTISGLWGNLEVME